MITVNEFLKGAELSYEGFNKKPHVATFQEGVGVHIKCKGKSIGIAPVTTGAMARALYFNLTRNNGD